MPLQQGQTVRQLQETKLKKQLMQQPRVNKIRLFFFSQFIYSSLFMFAQLQQVSLIQSKSLPLLEKFLETPFAVGLVCTQTRILLPRGQLALAVPALWPPLVYNNITINQVSNTKLVTTGALCQMPIRTNMVEPFRRRDMSTAHYNKILK